MSGTLTIMGSLVMSRNALEYNVSKLGRTTAFMSAAGKAGKLWNMFIGPKPGFSPDGRFVSCFRVISVVTSG